MRTEIIESWNGIKGHCYRPQGAIGFPTAVC